MCGALYVAYRSGKSVTGSYMLCALFRSYLILAQPAKQNGTKRYQVIANMALSNVQILDMDSEFGLQCLTIPYAWRILFEIDSAIFEILLVATSLEEQEKWRNAIQDAIERTSSKHDQFSVICSSISPIGEAIGKPGSVLRSIAMKDIASTRQQIVIQNTILERAGNIASTIRERMIYPILAPKRSDRVRIEEDIENAGCRETPKDHVLSRNKLLRASASSLLRKLSRSNKMQENRAT